MKKSNSEQILMLLKMREELDASVIAEELDITKEGARQHLLKLLEEGFVEKVCKSTGVGRPCTYYSISKHGLCKFPDNHAEGSIQLLKSVKNLLGENALDLLITDREKETFNRYFERLKNKNSLEDKLSELSEIRTEEGYLAEWKYEDENYYFIENHCPICSAATECQRFCRAELQNFRSLLGDQIQVERIQHIIADDNKCVYEIKKIKD